MFLTFSSDQAGNEDHLAANEDNRISCDSVAFPNGGAVSDQHVFLCEKKQLLRRLALAKALNHKYRLEIKILRRKLSKTSSGSKPKMGKTAQMLFDNERKNYGLSNSGKRFSKHIKMLAMRLAYYSTSGYCELRKWFTLPSTRVIRTELEQFNCDPGLLTDALEHIKSGVSAGTLKPDCTLKVELVIMACWDRAKKQIIGYANLPTNKQGHPASSSAVFYLVGIKTKLQFPVAYY